MDPRGIYDSQVLNETSSDVFVLHSRLPSLQEIAYNKIAIAVWYGYRSTPSQRQYEPHQLKSTGKLEVMDCHKLIKTLTMPRFMKEILKKYLNKVRKETIWCTQYFRFELLSENLEGYRIPQVDWEHFVWCPDGRINYKSTAIKMLHSGVLTEVQKFAIMSNFCLENEIKIFDLNRLPVETFIPKVDENRNFLLFYWIYYLKNELYRRIAPLFIISSYRHFILSSLIDNNLGAFEYFWNRLSAEHQVSFISARLRVYGYPMCWHYSLFCNMSHDQLTKLLFCHPVAMISLFIKEMEKPEWAIMAWKRCKNCITNEQFVSLLKNVLDRFSNNSILHQEHKASVLLEIWNTANDHHRNYAARQTELEIYAVGFIPSANYFRYHFAPVDPLLWKKLAPSSYKFLLKFLSLKSADFRTNFILDGDPSFIFNFDFNAVQEIFELCLPNFQGKVHSKYEWDKNNITYFCGILYSEEDYDELNRRLWRSFQNLNISSHDALKKCAKLLIMANKKEYKTNYACNGNDEFDLIRLSKFINKILQEDVSTVLKMKESYISSFSANSDPYEGYGSLNELSELIEQEFVHENLHKLKYRLAKKLQTRSVEQWVWYVSNYEKFTGVFSWCFENEEKMCLQVKRSIPINNIIVKVFEKIARRSPLFDVIDPPFDTVQRFLEWYFSGVADKVISFKLSIMNDPDTCKILENMQEHDKWLHGKCLQWIGKPNSDLHARKKSRGILSTTMNILQNLLEFAFL